LDALLSNCSNLPPFHSNCSFENKVLFEGKAKVTFIFFLLQFRSFYYFSAFVYLMFEQLFFNVIVKIAQLPNHYLKNRFRTGNNKHDFLNKNYKEDFYPFVPSLNVIWVLTY
jgi:hypothetical protein